jgi:transposase
MWSEFWSDSVEGYTVRRLAEKYGISRSTVKRTLRRIRTETRSEEKV